MKQLMEWLGEGEAILARKFGSRGLHQMSSVEFRRKVRQPGLHTDGGGLYLRVGKEGRQASWIAVYHLAERRREIGLGSADTVTLARAREKAVEVRELVDRGVDPIETRRAARSIPSFGKVADDWIKAQTPTVKSDKSVARWNRAVGKGGYAEPLRKRPINLITTDDVLGVLEPIWHNKIATAKNVRCYIENVLDRAKAQKLRVGDNPAAWEGNLEALLGTAKRTDERHAALPWLQMPAFWSDLTKRDACSARDALQFTILTVARTSETIEMKAEEVDLGNRVWTIPAERMKAGIKHEVPLNEAAIGVLLRRGIERLKPDDFVFPGAGKSGHLSNMAMLILLQKRMGRFETVHGFRSSFLDWCGDGTHHPRELAEMALAHGLDSDAEAAYRRGRALEKRRVIMEEWQAFLEGRLAPVGHEPKVATPAPIASKPKQVSRKAEANAYQTVLFDMSGARGRNANSAGQSQGVLVEQ